MTRSLAVRQALPALLGAIILIPFSMDLAPWAAQPPEDDRVDAPAPTAPSLDETFDAARLALRGGRAEEAASLLKPLDRSTMDEEQKRRLFLLGKDAALRTGDRDWLEQLNEVPERFAFADGYVILTSWSYLKAADFDSARFYLGPVKDRENLNERVKRRLLSIQSRIEQFDGTPETELEQVDQLVADAGRWASPTCMECHENPEHPGGVPFLDAAGWWPGHRYVELLRHFGTAEQIRDRSLERLATRPEDHDARLRLAYSLRALGEEQDAIEAFRSIYWADDTDDDPVLPRDILTFPWTGFLHALPTEEPRHAQGTEIADRPDRAARPPGRARLRGGPGSVGPMTLDSDRYQVADAPPPDEAAPPADRSGSGEIYNLKDELFPDD